MKFYIIGEREIVLAFKLTGIDGTAAETRAEVLDAFNRVTGKGGVVNVPSSEVNRPIKEIVSQPDYPQNSTIFCGYVSNSELVELYNMADCFVSASLGEGFGMPQLEAMLCGCPVVTAHNTAMIEVARNKTGVKSVEGYNPKDWIDCILDVVNKNETPRLAEVSEYYWPAIIQKLHEYMV